MTSPLYHQVNAVLGQFGAHVGLPGCALDDEGAAQLALDEVFVTLLLDEPAGSLLLLSPVGRPQPSSEIYGWLLDANLFWSGTAGATLARDAASGSVVLQRSLPGAGLDLEQFETALQTLVDAAERLRGRLAEHDMPGGEREDAAAALSQGDFA
jgi:hypothetical protein